ncbi:MAG: hypothetical protein ACE5GW_03270 [Planctomycetota bacterium]
MDGISCDRCGKGLLIDEDVRYEVTIEVKAAYDPMEITAGDLARDHEAEMEALIARLEGMSAKEAEDQVYRKLRFDLCLPCQRTYLRAPIPD